MPATYYPGVVQPGDATRITLGASDERVGLDFAMRLSHAASIDGTLVAPDGSTLPPVQVLIRGGGPELPVFGGSMSSGPSVSVRTAERTFRISNVAPGRYRIFARTFNAPGSGAMAISSGGARPPSADTAGVFWAESDVEIGGSDLTGVTLALQRAPGVTGRVAFASGSASPPATDASGVRVTLTPVAESSRGSNGLSAPIAATTRADGAFEFPAVIPGAYRLDVSPSGGWWPRSAIVNGRDALDQSLDVGATGIEGMAVTLSDRPASIAGTFTGPAGRPAPEHFIVVFASERAFWSPGSRRVVSVRPATDGGFEVRGLPPGSYQLAALTDLDPADLEDASFLESLVPSAVPVTLGEGERVVRDIRIAGGG
jgi:hypothetical protein